MSKLDFSVPRRMSKSALVIYFVHWLRYLLNIFWLVLLFLFFRENQDRSVSETALGFIGVAGGMLALAILLAFLQYYYQRFYISEGNLIVSHGFLGRETLSTPLAKVHSLRIKQGLLYRLFDMKGVTFDTLATQVVEIEMILDIADWEELLKQIEQSEQETDVQEELAEETGNVANSAESGVVRWSFRNWNLIRGALCQNHLKGTAVLWGILITVFNEISSVNAKIFDGLFEFLDAYADPTSASALVILIWLAGLYLFILLLWLSKVLLRYYNMEVRIGKQQLFFESGMLSRLSFKFSFDKVCTVYVKQNILERRLHCCTVMLKQALNVTAEKKGADVKIYGADSAAGLLNWWLGKDYMTLRVVASARSGYGLMNYVMRMDVLLVLVVATVLVMEGWYVWLVVPALYLLFSLIKGLSAVHRNAIFLKEDYIEVHTGRLASIVNYIKYEHVEVVRMVKTPFTPYFHRVHLVLATNGTHFTVRSLKEQEAREIYELLL